MVLENEIHSFAPRKPPTSLVDGQQTKEDMIEMLVDNDTWQNVRCDWDGGALSIRSVISVIPIPGLNHLGLSMKYGNPRKNSGILCQ